MKNLILEKISFSVEDTIKIANDFISSLGDKNCVLILSGDLGTGKTHFTKGIFKGLGFKNFNDITSPTFDLINNYEINDIKIHHCDLYRINKLSSEDAMWLNEILNEEGICIIEWGDKFNFQLDKNIYFIDLRYKNETTREIKIFTN